MLICDDERRLTSGAEVPSKQVAYFGTQGVNFRAYKPEV
jgi:hypothetical protein